LDSYTLSLHDALPIFTSPRAWAFALLGIQEYLDWFPGDRDAQQTRSVLATRLLELYGSNQSAEWNWFEDVLAYSNARLPQAVLIAGRGSSDTLMVSAALGALNWLTRVKGSPVHDYFVPIWSVGFFRREGERPRSDRR